MEGGKSRLGRFLNRLRGDHHKFCLDKGINIGSTAMSESTACGSTTIEDDDFLNPPVTHQAPLDISSTISDNDNIDLRYGGQYMTAEQLPAFCDNLHHLVEVIRNIQSYAQVTGEYPIELEKRLEREAREVAALAAETRNARDVIQRTRTQRLALRDHRKQLHDQLASLKDTEVRELESTVRLSDRKLYKNWETLKESNEPAAFEPLIEEIRFPIFRHCCKHHDHGELKYLRLHVFLRADETIMVLATVPKYRKLNLTNIINAKNKQNALECLLRLVEGRRSTLFTCSAPPQPLPPPMPKDSNDESSTVSGGVRKRHERRANKRRRNKEPRSVPLSNEPSAHSNLPQVTLYIQGSDTAGRRTGSVPITPVELPSGGSVRDILYFTTNAG